VWGKSKMQEILNKNRKLRVVLVQMKSGPDWWENLLHIQDLIEEARARWPRFDLICFPENCLFRGPRSLVFADKHDRPVLKFEGARLKRDSSFSLALEDMASHWDFGVCLGSVLEQSDFEHRPFNTLLWIEPKLRFVSYRKLHLFHFVSKRLRYEEFMDVHPGHAPQLINFGFFRFGMSICYDLRFPEFYRWMAIHEGMEVALIPAAFTYLTGQDHWHCLLKARAIENRSYVLAAGQWGWHQSERAGRIRCYGHTIAIDPWGNVLDELPEDGDGMFMVELSRQKLFESRDKLQSVNDSFFQLSPRARPL